jgi:hypothetical protein
MINLNTVYSNNNLHKTKFNFTFEESFYKIFLNGLILNQPTIKNSNDLLLLSPHNYCILSNVNIDKDRKDYKYFKYLPSSTLISNDSNYFYLTSLDFKKINFFLTNPELINFNTQIYNQIYLINNLRWSYRYSNLHRRIIFNSHKLTESKKLISSGFFDNNITNVNLWFSDKYARSLNSNKKQKKKNIKTICHEKFFINQTFYLIKKISLQ